MQLKHTVAMLIVVAAVDAHLIGAQVQCRRPPQVTTRDFNSYVRRLPRLTRIVRSDHSAERKATAIDSLLPETDDVRVLDYLFCEATRRRYITRSEYQSLVRQVLRFVPGVREYRLTDRRETAEMLLQDVLNLLSDHATDVRSNVRVATRILETRDDAARGRVISPPPTDTARLHNLADDMRRLCWHVGPAIPERIRAVLPSLAALNTNLRLASRERSYNPRLADDLNREAIRVRSMLASLDSSIRSALNNSVLSESPPFSRCSRDWVVLRVSPRE
jgi:hypothetical protein